MKTTLGFKIGRVVVAIVRPIAYILFPYTFVNRDHIPNDNKPLIVCCNHISMLDPVFLMLAFRRPVYFMGKEELFKNRLFGWLLRTLFGVFPVSRGRGDAGAVTKALAVIEEGNVMGIFPEGTRSKDGKLGQAKAGAALIAAKTQADVLPCAVIAKDGKVRLFHRSKVVFGKVMTPQELSLSGEKPDLRYSSRKIMAAIADLMEANR